MRTPIPQVTDTQFAFGFRSAAAPALPTFRSGPSASASRKARAWRAVASHIIEFGLGERPELTPRPDVDLDNALRMLGALLATPETCDDPDAIGRLLATWFLRVRPQGGPLATAL